MDNETWIKIDTVAFWSFVGLGVVALVGEVLGWWNDVGEWLGAIRVVGTVLALVDRHGRQAVRGQQGMQATQDHMETTQQAMLANHQATLTNQEAMLDRQDEANGHLVRIVAILDDRLPPSS